jgi:hypothetical protein
MSHTTPALKRSRDVDGTKQLPKRVRQHDPAEIIDEYTALVQPYSLAPTLDCSAVRNDEILRISSKDTVNTCNTVLVFYDYDLYVLYKFILLQIDYGC